MIVTEQQNTMANGYGHSISKKHPLLAAWAKFYGLKNGFPLFSDACSRVAAEKAGKADNNTGYRGADGKEIGRFVELQGGWQRVFLDTLVYRERMRISVETFLAEAEERAKEVGQQAFVHIVGLGLGVSSRLPYGWSICTMRGSGRFVASALLCFFSAFAFADSVLVNLSAGLAGARSSEADIRGFVC